MTTKTERSHYDGVICYYLINNFNYIIMKEEEEEEEEKGLFTFYKEQ